MNTCISTENLLKNNFIIDNKLRISVFFASYIFRHSDGFCVNDVWRARNAEFRFLSFVLNAFPSTLPPIKNGCSTRHKGEDKTREDKTMNTNRKEQWKAIKGYEGKYEVSNMGRVMSLYVVGGNFGAAVAPATVMFLLDRYGLDILPLLAIPAVVLGILFYFSGLYKLPSANAKKVSSSESTSIIKIFANPSVALLNIAMGLRCCTHVSVSTFLPMLMLSHGASNVVSGSMLTVFLMGTAAGGLIGGELGDKFGHKRLMVVSLALTALPTILFFLYPDAGFISSLLLFMGGFFVQAPQPSSIVWTGRLMPQYIGVASGMMMGLCFGLGSIGAAVTAALGDYIGLETAMFLSVVPVVIATILVIFTPYTKGVVVPKRK